MLCVLNNTKMIGNIILAIKKFWKQQTCMHKYKWVYRRDNGDSFETCSKCEILK